MICLVIKHQFQPPVKPLQIVFSQRVRGAAADAANPDLLISRPEVHDCFLHGGQAKGLNSVDQPAQRQCFAGDDMELDVALAFTGAFEYPNHISAAGENISARLNIGEKLGGREELLVERWQLFQLFQSSWKIDLFSMEKHHTPGFVLPENDAFADRIRYRSHGCLFARLNGKNDNPVGADTN